MSYPGENQWRNRSMEYLLQSLQGIRTILKRAAGGPDDLNSSDVYGADYKSAKIPGNVTGIAGGQSARSEDNAAPAEEPWERKIPPAIAALCSIFNLSHFERQIILLCVGMELDPEFPRICAHLNGSANMNYPTFQLAFSFLEQPHLSVLSPAHPLRYWKFIEVGGGPELTRCPLRLDERTLNYLLGVDHLDQRLTPLLEPPPVTGELVPSQYAAAERMAKIWLQSTRGVPPVFILYGNQPGCKRAVAVEVAQLAGLGIEIMPANLVPTTCEDLESLGRLWQREALLGGKILLLDCDEIDPGNPANQRAVNHLVECIGGLVIITSRQHRPLLHRPWISFEIGKPTAAEQRVLWQQALGDRAREIQSSWIERLVYQFNLEPAAVRSVCLAAINAGKTGEDQPEQPAPPLATRLWENCRRQARPRLDGLVQRIEPKAHWHDLILPEAQLQVLKDIVMHVRQRARVYETWEFAAQGSRGLGISVLFAGASGTGKTMAAEVLARELKLDLFRIDLSRVVDKYIGETEKNLRQVFDNAEEAGAILLFDEADALFGSRSQVKDSHDRYANIEVSYLLQRMETYHGLAVLTSNLKDSLDKAFLRRLRFIVHFPFPGPEERAAIWNRIFPRSTPTRDLDISKLARLNISGGHIRNIALNAAFIAAEEDNAIIMPHLLQAARKEYSKLEKNLTQEEIKGWI